MPERQPRRVRTAALCLISLCCAVFALAASTTERRSLRWPVEGPPILEFEMEGGGSVGKPAPEWGAIQTEASKRAGWHVALTHLANGQRVGRLSVTAAWSDRRGQPIAVGEYALRYAVQPLSKDHLGTAARRDFLFLVPRDADPLDEVVGETTLWELGRRASRTRHPAVMEVRITGPASPLATGEEAVRGSLAGVDALFLVTVAQPLAGALEGTL